MEGKQNMGKDQREERRKIEIGGYNIGMTEREKKQGVKCEENKVLRRIREIG